MNNLFRFFRFITRKWQIFWILNLIGSIAVRIPGLSDKASWWRAVQTEMSAHWMVKNGIDFFHYQTPVYGPPWEIPFEFPLYQALGALTAQLGIVNIGTACRLITLLSFYLCAVFLYFVTREIYRSTALSRLIVIVFLWTPYNIYYSTEPLIDFTALALAFGYFYFILRWLASPSLHFWGGALLMGSLGMLVKVTTMPVVVVPIVVAVVQKFANLGFFAKPVRLAGIIEQGRRNWRFILQAAVLALVPILLTGFWTAHADQIKSISTFTRWLGSKALHDWNYGTWEQKTDPVLWVMYLNFFRYQLMPYGLSLFVVIGFIGMRRTQATHRYYVPALAASILLTMLIFFNLFRHEYYYIAFSGSAAILIGFGMWHFWHVAEAEKPVVKYVITAVVLGSALLSVRNYTNFRNFANEGNTFIEMKQAWAKEAQRFIPEDKWAVIIQTDEEMWEPINGYVLDRKVMVATSRELEHYQDFCETVNDPNFVMVVSFNNTPYEQKVLDCFASYQEVMPGIYTIEQGE